MSLSSYRTFRPPASVTALAPQDVLRVDAEPLIRLQASQGHQAAQEAVLRAREEIALRLGRIDERFRAGDRAAVLREARGIADAAGPVGLADLVRAAGHAATCAGRNDPAALAATVARVCRLGDRALSMIGTLRSPGA